MLSRSDAIEVLAVNPMNAGEGRGAVLTVTDRVLPSLVVATTSTEETAGCAVHKSAPTAVTPSGKVISRNALPGWFGGAHVSFAPVVVS